MDCKLNDFDVGENAALGNALPLQNITVGTVISIELRPDSVLLWFRSAGNFAQLTSRRQCVINCLLGESRTNTACL